MTIHAIERGIDYYLLDELLTAQERDVRDRTRAFCDEEIVPIINGLRLPRPIKCGGGHRRDGTIAR